MFVYVRSSSAVLLAANRMLSPNRTKADRHTVSRSITRFLPVLSSIIMLFSFVSLGNTGRNFSLLNCLNNFRPVRIFLSILISLFIFSACRGVFSSEAKSKISCIYYENSIVSCKRCRIVLKLTLENSKARAASKISRFFRRLIGCCALYKIHPPGLFSGARYMYLPSFVLIRVSVSRFGSPPAYNLCGEIQ